jgi:PIN domain nuclease of toxin-antitoxin system
MDLLLDTHIWLWSVAQPKRLTARVARELTRSSNQLWLSPVSVWELYLLHSRGRIQLDGSTLEDWVQKTCAKLQLNEATLTIEVMLELPKLNLPHGDPADGFLVATSQVLGLTLVTADENLIHVPGIRVLANR